MPRLDLCSPALGLTEIYAVFDHSGKQAQLLFWTHSCTRLHEGRAGPEARVSTACSLSLSASRGGGCNPREGDLAVNCPLSKQFLLRPCLSLPLFQERTGLPGRDPEQSPTGKQGDVLGAEGASLPSTSPQSSRCLPLVPTAAAFVRSGLSLGGWPFLRGRSASLAAETTEEGEEALRPGLQGKLSSLSRLLLFTVNLHIS